MSLKPTIWHRRRPVVAREMTKNEIDALDFRRRSTSAGEHLRATGPYRPDYDKPLSFDEYHGFASVALDRVYRSRAGTTVHIVTPAQRFGRSIVQQAEQIAEKVRRRDPDLNGLVFFWPRGSAERSCCMVALFEVVDEPMATHQGRLVVTTDAGVAVDAQRQSQMSSRYINPTLPTCTPADLADVLGLPVDEVDLLIPEIDQRVARAPGWWEAIAEAKALGAAAQRNLQAVLGEWGLE